VVTETRGQLVEILLEVGSRIKTKNEGRFKIGDEVAVCYDFTHNKVSAIEAVTKNERELTVASSEPDPQPEVDYENETTEACWSGALAPEVGCSSGDWDPGSGVLELSPGEVMEDGCDL